MHSLKNNKLLRLLQYLPIMVIVVFTIALNMYVINSNERKITALLDAVHHEVLETKQQQVQTAFSIVDGTGFYTSDITKVIEQKKQKLIAESHFELQIMLAFSVMLTILLTVVVLVIGK